MIARLAVVFTALLTGCYGQTFEIRAAAGVPSEPLLIRYFLEGSFGGFNGWIDARLPQGIEMVHEGQPATAIKALLYAPGCAIETFSRELTETRDRYYEFQCRAQRTFPLRGQLQHPDRMDGTEFTIRVNYVAYWAHSFFGKDDGPVVTTIPIGMASADAAGRFEVVIPDFSEAPWRDGAFEFQVREKASGNLLGRLSPQVPGARLGNLPVAARYADDFPFDTCPEVRRVLPTLVKRYTDACR